MLKIIHILTLVIKLMRKILNSKLDHVWISKHTPNWSEEDFSIKEVKILFHGHMLLMIWMVKKTLQQELEKELRKTNQK